MNKIGILYPGGLGSALGAAILKAGGIPTTCLSERSYSTRLRAQSIGFAIVQSLEKIAQECELVISLVPPSSALDAARRFSGCFAATDRSGGAKPLFLDANSVGPQTKRRIGEIMSDAGISCLDGAFFGPANRIGRDNLLALSGPCVEQIRPLMAGILEVRVMGPEIGQASAAKMALAMVTKALPALFLEMGCAAQKSGQLEACLDLMRRLHPGIMTFIERTLPTYPAYVSRRVGELKEMVQWLSDLGQRGAMTTSALSILEDVRHAHLDSSTDWTFNDLLYCITTMDVLRSP